MVTIQEFTTKKPITMIGYEAGVCWGADVADEAKNYKRGWECLTNQHGRTYEFPDVYMTIEGYSARCIREWYTHIGCLPTRLQASTRYINYGDFEAVVPTTIVRRNESGETIETEAYKTYVDALEDIRNSIKKLIDLGVPKEDANMLLPLGMTSKIVDKRNLRNLIDMSHQRECSRAYWEYRQLFSEISLKLSHYSEEWEIIVDKFFVPKCEYLGYCPEKYSCGKMSK